MVAQAAQQGSQYMLAPVIVQCIEGHLEQLVGLAQSVPCTEVMGAEVHCCTVCLCSHPNSPNSATECGSGYKAFGR